MTKTLDARGLACPAPVLLVKDAVENEDLNELSIMVDNEASRENVTRFLGTRNYSVSKSSQGSDFLLFAHREGGGSAPMASDVSGTDSISGIKPQNLHHGGR